MQIDDEWRRWIAENMLLGSTSEQIFATLIERGFDEESAALEISQAVNSPYLRGAMRLVNRFVKREWLLAIYRKLDTLRSEHGVIPRKHKLNREEFFRDYYCLNRPVIITGMLDDWPALKKWNVDYLQAQYGDRLIEVQTNRNSNSRYEIECSDPRHRQTMTVTQVVDKIRKADKSNDIYVTAGNSSLNRRALNELWSDITQLPEYLDGNSPQDGFFWFGPAGTITPLHHDLTNNFMAQVYGRKKITLIPSYDILRVYNNFHCFSELDIGNVNKEKYPLFSRANTLELTLNPGEILFLPVACWHYVEALDNSITMSFTNFLADNDFHSFYYTYNEV